MPGLSYPFVFQCHKCETEATVTRTEARDLYPNPDSLTAVDEVLQQEKGWTNDERGAYCPDCDPPDVETWRPSRWDGKD